MPRKAVEKEAPPLEDQLPPVEEAADLLVEDLDVQPDPAPNPDPVASTVEDRPQVTPVQLKERYQRIRRLSALSRGLPGWRHGALTQVDPQSANADDLLDQCEQDLMEKLGHGS